MERVYQNNDLSYTQNRELSWLKFDERVLSEARRRRRTRRFLYWKDCGLPRFLQQIWMNF